MNKYFIVIFILVIKVLFVYGESSAVSNGECIAVNKLLGKSNSNNCCNENGITCSNGHVIRM